MQSCRLWVCVAAFSLAWGCGSDAAESNTTPSELSTAPAEGSETEQTSALSCAGLAIVISSSSDDLEERITIQCGTTEITYDDGERTRTIEMEAWERAWRTLDRLDWEHPAEGCSAAVMSVVRGRDPDLQRICVSGESPNFQEVFYTAREVIAPFDTP